MSANHRVEKIDVKGDAPKIEIIFRLVVDPTKFALDALVGLWVLGILTWSDDDFPLNKEADKGDSQWRCQEHEPHRVGEKAGCKQ